MLLPSRSAVTPGLNIASVSVLITDYTIASVRTGLAQWRKEGAQIGFVATMGNLHPGHLSLVHAARSQADRVVASIFVNPLQFGPDEDYAVYPRTLAADSSALETAGCDLLFAPSTHEMYPNGQSATQVSVGALGDVLCGAHRVGHFDGMATVVTKLLSIIQPDVAIFGQKDFQQLTVIRRLVLDLNIPVSIHGVPTAREPDGLAMSSRNAFLDDDDRAVAPLLHATLLEVAEQIADGARDYHAICLAAISTLTKAGFRPDYVEVRNAVDLSEPDDATQKLVILAAAGLGRTRLIDNIQLNLQTVSAARPATVGRIRQS